MRCKMGRFQFSEEQKEYIKDNWGKESAHSMKKKFGCSWATVVNAAVALGLDPPNRIIGQKKRKIN